MFSQTKKLVSLLVRISLYAFLTFHSHDSELNNARQTNKNNENTNKLQMQK